MGAVCSAPVAARLSPIYFYFLLFSGVGSLHAVFPLNGPCSFMRRFRVFVSAAGSLAYMLFFDLDGFAPYAHACFSSCNGLSLTWSSTERNPHRLSSANGHARERITAREAAKVIAVNQAGITLTFYATIKKL